MIDWTDSLAAVLSNRLSLDAERRAASARPMERIVLDSRGQARVEPVASPVFDLSGSVDADFIRRAAASAGRH